MKPITRVFDLLEGYRDIYHTKPDAFLARKASGWEAYSASDYITLSRDLSLGLLSLGLLAGTRVATVLLNGPEWNVVDMAIMQVGAVHVPIYPTISEENYQYILSDSGVEYLFISNREIYRRIKKVLPGLPAVKGIFTIEKIPGVTSWTELIKAGNQMPDPGLLDKIRNTITPDDLVSIIYTSGTTGLPKGVMLSHRNFVSNFMACAEIPKFSCHNRALSFLPLCHVYERMLNYVYQYLGMSVYYSQSLEQLPEHLMEVRPHTFAAVPRVLEKIYNRFVTYGRGLSGFRRKIFFWGLRQGHRFDLNTNRTYWNRIKLAVADKLIFKRWRRAMGSKIRIIVSGGASLHPRLARIFWAAGMPVIEGYGLTETSPVIAVQNLGPGGVRFGTVGSALPGVEVKIAPDGEILCRGPNVMLGYCNKPELTREAIDEESWFHTGDIGTLIDGKYIRITDRKKEIFKTSSGKYIAPQPIEQRFVESPFIDYIMVIGENRKYAAALIVPNAEHLKNWCRIKQIPFHSPREAVRHPAILTRFNKEINLYNQDLGQTDKIKKFRLMEENWSVETGELSPTMKLRRKFIQEKYYQEIEETYRSPEYNYKAEDQV